MLNNCKHARHLAGHRQSCTILASKRGGKAARPHGFLEASLASVLSSAAHSKPQLQIVRLAQHLQGPPLKLEFSLGSLSAAFGSNIVIPASPSTESYYSPTPYYSPTTPDNTMSPVAAYFAEGSTQPGVAYDGYLDQCAVRPLPSTSSVVSALSCCTAAMHLCCCCRCCWQAVLKL